VRKTTETTSLISSTGGVKANEPAFGRKPSSSSSSALTSLSSSSSSSTTTTLA